MSALAPTVLSPIDMAIRDYLTHMERHITRALACECTLLVSDAQHYFTCRQDARSTSMTNIGDIAAGQAKLFYSSRAQDHYASKEISNGTDDQEMKRRLCGSFFYGNGQSHRYGYVEADAQRLDRRRSERSDTFAKIILTSKTCDYATTIRRI